MYTSLHCLPPLPMPVAELPIASEDSHLCFYFLDLSGRWPWCLSPAIPVPPSILAFSMVCGCAPSTSAIKFLQHGPFLYQSPFLTSQPQSMLDSLRWHIAPLTLHLAEISPPSALLWDASGEICISRVSVCVVKCHDQDNSQKGLLGHTAPSSLC